MKDKKLKPIMFVGTCSDAGKSIVNTAFCRIFQQDGYTPAPFKAQNMSLNSYSTLGGGEIGRAQAVQAEACGIAPHTDMNPVLLKPTNEKTSQVVLNGHPIGNVTAKDYFSDTKNNLFDEAIAAFHRLETQYNPVVMEGAGSISELNLRDRDITNMRMAKAVGADTYLVADIDRGGVFGAVYGSILLLPPEERVLMKGIIINKFRGERALFEGGCQMIMELTGIPVVGVIPYFTDIHIEEEDSMALIGKRKQALDGKINVAVVLLPCLSNFTDFSVLEQDERFHLYYTDEPEELEKAHIIILPGSKNTIADLLHIRTNGIAAAVLRAHREGKKIIGICGGYQMMGKWIEDPDGIESRIKAAPGLGILPQLTVLTPEKVTRQREFKFQGKEICTGYEIHMGQTETEGGMPEQPLNIMDDRRTDGYRLNANCWGTYMHGILDNSAVLNDLAQGLNIDVHTEFEYSAFKEKQYDLLAAHVRESVDMEYIYSNLISSDDTRTR